MNIKRPYEMIIKIGGDSVEDIIADLDAIQFSLIENKERGRLLEAYQSIMGGSNCGHVWKLVRTETADHDAYFKEIEAELEKGDKNEN